jgi:hypothetical protein
VVFKTQIEKPDLYKRITTVYIDVKKKDNDGKLPDFINNNHNDCKHVKDHPIRFCRAPDTETTDFML